MSSRKKTQWGKNTRPDICCIIFLSSVDWQLDKKNKFELKKQQQKKQKEDNKEWSSL